MTQEKEEQLKHIKEEFVKLVDIKFRRGAEEHKESLMDLNLLEEAVLELVDGIVYLLLAIKKTTTTPMSTQQGEGSCLVRYCPNQARGSCPLCALHCPGDH